MAIDPIDLPTYISDLEAGSVWGSSDLNYMFWTSTPSYYLPEDFESHGFKPFTAADKAVAYEALNMLSSFANITFTEVTNQTDNEGIVQIGFGKAILDVGAEAWAYYPDDVDPRGGDVWANTTYFSENRLGHGQYDFLTIVHELGHAVGLKHSFETPALPPEFESRQYTVMSYSGGAHYGNAEPETYMPLDILTIQALYGANMSYATGDDDYALKAGHIYTIWDAGGTDALDGSLIGTPMTLDLNAGAYSTVSAAQAGFSDNIAIAYGVTIENAFGGRAGDVIYGNDADNLIYGNGGNDTVHVSVGYDIVDGGVGTDKFYFDSAATGDFTFDVLDAGTVLATAMSDGSISVLQHFEKFYFSDGADVLTFAQLQTLAGGIGPPVDLVLNGSAGPDALTGASGNDTITGNAGNDNMFGNAGNDTLDGGAGTDVMTGGLGDDVFYVDNVRDRVIEGFGPGTGTDTIHSTLQAFTMSANVEILIIDDGGSNGTGNRFANTMIGNAANNSLNGLGGNDILDGNGGHDVLTGSGGADTFVFHAATAYDASSTITDFKISDGDKIDLSDLLTAYDPFSDSLGDFVQITAGAGKNTAILSVDADGTGGGSDFVQIATLNGITFSTLPHLSDVDTLEATGRLITS